MKLTAHSALAVSLLLVAGCSQDRKSTRLNSSHRCISYAVFCLKKKNSVDRFVIVSIFIPKLRLILILNSFLGSSDSLVFSELFHSLAPRPLAARSSLDFLLTY